MFVDRSSIAFYTAGSTVLWMYFVQYFLLRSIIFNVYFIRRRRSYCSIGEDRYFDQQTI